MSISFSTLNEWLDYIAQSHPSEIELGLDRVRAVYQKMALDRPESKVVIVAGTNGKGSTIALIEAGLSSLGYAVGSYTSPHILHYNERVRLNGRDVKDAQLISAFEQIERARGDIALTYFEFGTLAAIQLLFQANLDVILLEVGLGGRLDAVNIIDADMSIITSIDVDHTDWLGNDVEMIGAEKAGVMRNGQLCLTGENLPNSVYLNAEELSCHLLRCHSDFSIENGILSLKCEDDSVNQFDGFPGLALPVNNILLALQATLLLVGPENFDYQKVKSGYSRASIPGRLERVCPERDIYLDVGHNPHAAQFLAGFVKQKRAEGMYIEVVYSALADKDVSGVVSALAPYIDRWLVAPLKVDRALELSELLAKVRMHAKNVLSFENTNKALAQACGDFSAERFIEPSGQPKLVLVFGSFFMIEAAKRYIEAYE